MNRVEKNKLIAEFMGAVQSYKPYAPNEDMEFHMYGVIECIEDGLDEQHYFLPDDMNFDTDWSWLMPVVHKCLFICHEKELNEWEIFFSDRFFTCNITKMYEAVVEFIEWYNQNK